MKMKNRSHHRYDINTPRSRHGHKYNKYKKYLTTFVAQFMKSLVTLDCFSFSHFLLLPVDFTTYD